MEMLLNLKVTFFTCPVVLGVKNSRLRLSRIKKKVTPAGVDFIGLYRG
jgi:hypothetical protein